MTYRIDLAGDLRVTAAGTPVGFPPTAATAVLLIGLAERGSAWSGRAELAARLYPRQSEAGARGALRQTIKRLRDWLGADVLEVAGSRCRLAQAWTIGLNLSDGTPAPRELLCPGLGHEWLDDLKRQWRSNHNDSDQTDEFVRFVELVSKLSTDEGRAILVAGQALLWNLRADTVSRLIALTRPTRRTDPCSPEYAEMVGLIEPYIGSLARACRSLEYAYRIGLDQNCGAVLDRIACWGVFSAIESGDTAAARRWEGRLGSSNRFQTLTANARAALSWNCDRLDEAMSIMQAARSKVASAERSQQVHFWANFAALAADLGDIEGSLQADEKCLKLAVPRLDGRYLASAALASVGRQVQRRDYSGATTAVTKLRETFDEKGWVLAGLYAAELQADLAVKQGDAQRAKRLWAAAIAARERAEGVLNPRLRARVQAIELL